MTFLTARLQAEKATTMDIPTGDRIHTRYLVHHSAPGAWHCSAPFVFSAASATALCVGQESISTDNAYNIPVVEFTIDGQKHRVEARGILGMQFKSGYREGHRMTVLYPPEHPDEARAEGIACHLQFPMAFLGMGGVFEILGAWMVKKQTKPQQDAQDE